MSNKRIQSIRLDPMKKATADEVALVIEQGNSYLQAISSKRQKLYKMCETFNETIESLSLKGMRYDLDGGDIRPDGHDGILRILLASEKQMREHERVIFEDLQYLSYEEEKFFAIYRAYTSLRSKDVRMLEAFYADGKEAGVIIKEIYKGNCAIQTFWKRKKEALNRAADNCTYTPTEEPLKGAI